MPRVSLAWAVLFRDYLVARVDTAVSVITEREESEVTDYSDEDGSSSTSFRIEWGADSGAAGHRAWPQQAIVSQTVTGTSYSVSSVAGISCYFSARSGTSYSVSGVAGTRYCFSDSYRYKRVRLRLASTGYCVSDNDRCKLLCFTGTRDRETQEMHFEILADKVTR